MEEERTHHLLEINIISAQDLKPPSSFRRRLHTYAVVHVDPARKLRTLTDRSNFPNPTWNDKFLFHVTPSFLSSATSAVSVSLYASSGSNFLSRDPLLGTARLLLSSCHVARSSSATPAFSAVQIRRPSGRFQGILNAAIGLADTAALPPAMCHVAAICMRDLLSETHRGKSDSGGDCDSFSDGGESTASTSSSSSSSSAAVIRRGSDGGGLVMCCLGMKGKGHLGPSDGILRVLTSQVKQTSKING